GAGGLAAVPQQRHLRVHGHEALAVEPEELELRGGGEDAAGHDGHGAGHGDAEDRQAAGGDQPQLRGAVPEGGDDDVLGDAADDRGGRDLQQPEGGGADEREQEPALLLPGADEQALQPGDQHGGVLGAAQGPDGRGAGGVALRAGGVGPGGTGGGGEGVHAVTKWTTTARAKVMVESMARENSMRMPVPSALMATTAELTPRRQSCRRRDSAMYRPSRNPIGRPRNGMTKKPTMPEAI